MELADYLRYEKIVVDSPYEQENLRPKAKIEIGKNAAVFENYYQAKGEKIFCHICGGHRHHKGITGVLDDGQRILFGRKCAIDYFGPEITKLHAAELRRRTTDAHARYKIRVVQGQLEEINDWLNSYRSLVVHCGQAWVNISARYPEPYKEITEHLRKYNGRIVDQFVHELRKPEGGVERLFEEKILLHVKNSDSIPHLTQVAQRLTLIDSFVDAVSNLNFQPTDQSIRNLNRMFKKMIDAASEIDGCLNFTHDIFKPEKLNSINSWCEKRRQARLSDHKNTNNRDLEKLFT
ncbi:hypothetical protein, partial [Hoeflea sp.]|uniref:hypothetical protein n=1 Tax=Hoeflea sp. TaxID=1940281 RepID=UPI003A8CECA4